MPLKKVIQNKIYLKMKKLSDIFSNIPNKIKTSFKKIIKGEEEMKNLIWFWGVVSYVTVYFLFNFIIRVSQSYFITFSLSLITIIYFLFHIFALKKCQPKKKKLTKEEKKLLQKNRGKNFSKSFFRKLTLQEPITKWNTVNILIALDLLYILIFFEYIIE